MPHRNPDPPNRTACAPYNFVPLPERVVRAVESPEDLPDHHRFTNPRRTHSGYIEVELKTETPLFIRGPLTRREQRHAEANQYIDGEHETVNKQKPQYKRLAKNKPDFFYIDPDTREPVIPGSSLRGMLENIVEIITYSKFTRFTNRQLLFRAVGDKACNGTAYRDQICGPNQSSPPYMYFDYPHESVRGGYLLQRDGEYFIQPATTTTDGDSIVHVQQDDLRDARIRPNMNGCAKLWVKPERRRDDHDRTSDRLTLQYTAAELVSGAPLPGYLPGYVIRTSSVGRGIPRVSGPKHMDCVILEPDWSRDPIRIDPDLVAMYRADCDDPTSRTRKLLEEYDATRHTEGPSRERVVPLFYKVGPDQNLVYFGSTLMFRLPYVNGIEDCVPEHLRHEEDVDFRDAMFGFVSKRDEYPQGAKGFAYSSRVRVTDGRLQADQTNWHLGTEPLTPKILSSPKATCFQHYLEQDRPNAPDHLVHYDSDEPRIRGQKAFWHQQTTWHDPQPATAMIANDNHDLHPKQRTYMHPLRGGRGSDSQDRRLAFRFRIDFEALADHELGALLWAIAPEGPVQADGRPAYCHKLGMGKPYGMGSVSLRTISCTKIDRTQRYQSLLGEDNQWHEAKIVVSEDEMRSLRRGFESYMLTALELPTDLRYHQVGRIAMLLQMMQWPGQRVTPAASHVVANRQERAGNVRYMTIELPGFPTNHRPAREKNEYSDRPVLPDPTAWMDRNVVASSLVEPVPPELEPAAEIVDSAADAAPAALAPEITIATGDGNHPFPRFSVGDVIEVTAGEKWNEKKQKMALVYQAADGARAVFDGNPPTADAEGRLLGRVRRIEPEAGRYVLTTKLA
jgi:CRISPR-associated protein (TIGR03986 family)